MRLPDAGDPWTAYLPPGASPAAIALAKSQYLSQHSPAHYTPPNLHAPTPAYDPGVANAVGVGPAPGLAPGTGIPGAPPAWDPNTDPGVIAANAAGVRDRHDAIVGYGNASGLGADADTAAQAAANPYSVVAQLHQQLQRNLGGINNSANAHGLLFSGANVQGQQNEFAAGAQRGYNANQQLQAALNGITDRQTAAATAAAYTRMATGGAA